MDYFVFHVYIISRHVMACHGRHTDTLESRGYQDHALLDSAARFSGCGLCVVLLLGRHLAVPPMQSTV